VKPVRKSDEEVYVMLGSTIAKSKPLVEDLQHLQEKSLKLVSENLPKFADAARQKGRSVRDSVSDMASSAGGAIHKALPSSDAFDAIRATGTALASAAALQAAQRGVLRFATRRPLLFALGGLAVVGGLILVTRRRKGAGPDPVGEEIGEGSYKGARDYADSTKAFLKAEGKRVTTRARQAEKALEGEEGAALEAAEAEGRSHARS
jgi:hypothetical protein